MMFALDASNNETVEHVREVMLLALKRVAELQQVTPDSETSKAMAQALAFANDEANAPVVWAIVSMASVSTVACVVHETAAIRCRGIVQAVAAIIGMWHLQPLDIDVPKGREVC